MGGTDWDPCKGRPGPVLAGGGPQPHQEQDCRPEEEPHPTAVRTVWVSGLGSLRARRTKEASAPQAGTSCDTRIGGTARPPVGWTQARPQADTGRGLCHHLPRELTGLWEVD